MYDLVIIGAGAAGSSLFIHLMTQEIQNSIRDIAFLDSVGLGNGIAFNREERFILCNTSVGVNSLFAADPTHFLVWLRENPELCRTWGVDTAALTLSSFVPRGLFKAYLQAFLAQARMRARALGISLHHIPAKARRIERTGDGYVILDDREEQLIARSVAVCTGLSLPNAPLPGRVMGAGFAQSPYDITSYDEFLGDCASVLIIGSRQGAIDAALLVAQARPGCSVVMMSRSGCFPSVRSEMVEQETRCFTTARLRAALSQSPREFARTYGRLLREELYAVSGPERARSMLEELQRVDPSPTVQLGRDLEATLEDGGGWEQIDRGIITVTNQLWPEMAMPQRREIRHTFGPIIRRFVSAIPATNARKILALHAEGRLRVVRGPARCSTYRGQWVFEDSEGRRHMPDRVINATGFMVSRGGAPLTISSTPLGDFSEQIDPFTFSVRQSDSSRLFFLGPPLGEALAVTNYMNSTARQAERVARLFAS